MKEMPDIFSIFQKFNSLVLNVLVVTMIGLIAFGLVIVVATELTAR